MEKHTLLTLTPPSFTLGGLISPFLGGPGWVVLTVACRSAKPQSLFAKTVGKQAEAKGLGTPAQDDGGEEGDGKA